MATRPTEQWQRILCGVFCAGSRVREWRTSLLLWGKGFPDMDLGELLVDRPAPIRLRCLRCIDAALGCAKRQKWLRDLASI